MSEEQPTFKVTDRRLFNADGTPREIEHQEAPKTETSAEEAKTASAIAGENRSQSSTQTTQTTQSAAAPTAASAQTAESGATRTTGASHAPDEQIPEDDYAGSDIPGADDPASFVNFLMSIASNAAAALGMMEHPVTGQRSVDIELGKHWIDILGMLKEKTRGNLAPQEQQIFDGLLADLRMQYVSLTSARQPKAPRGFTGSDITGGR